MFRAMVHPSRSGRLTTQGVILAAALCGASTADAQETSHLLGRSVASAINATFAPMEPGVVLPGDPFFGMAQVSLGIGPTAGTIKVNGQVVRLAQGARIMDPGRRIIASSRLPLLLRGGTATARVALDEFGHATLVLIER